MKAVVAAFNQEKALVGASSVITNLRMELFEALVAELKLPHPLAGNKSIILTTQIFVPLRRRRYDR